MAQVLPVCPIACFISPHGFGHAARASAVMVHAGDAAIGKAGYSTVAEAYRAGIPFGFIVRQKFREAGIMARFIERKMRGIEISAAAFESGGWLARLDDLLALPRRPPRLPNGAEQIADFILGLL